jgi:hypothetical protein
MHKIARISIWFIHEKIAFLIVQAVILKLPCSRIAGAIGQGHSGGFHPG